MRRPEARSAEIERPEGVSRCFHVSLYKVEPTEAVLRRNLLSKDFRRSALADEMVPVGPKVPLVSKPACSACRAERLARTTTCPDRAIIGPSGATESVTPHPDPGEEMALGELGTIVGSEVTNISPVHDARRDQTGSNQVFKPIGRIWVDLIVKRGHAASRRISCCQARTAVDGQKVTLLPGYRFARGKVPASIRR